MRSRVPWWMRVHGFFLPVMGPAQVGPYEDEPPPSTAKSACPLCGRAMDAHTFDRSSGVTTKMRCPARAL